MKKLFILFMCLLLAGTASATTVTRSFSSSAVEKNVAVTTTLVVDVTGSDTYYVIDEKIPDGLTVNSASNSGDFTTTAGHVFWTVLSGAADTTYTYVLNSGNGDVTYSFSGTYGSESNQETPILGANSLKVGTGAGTGGTTSPPATSSGNSTNWLLYGAIIVGAIFVIGAISKKK